MQEQREGGFRHALTFVSDCCAGPVDCAEREGERERARAKQNKGERERGRKSDCCQHDALAICLTLLQLV